MGRLTFGDCLSQPQGTEGRLFEVDDSNADAFRTFHEIPDSQGLAGTYRVLRVQEDRMQIEAYMLGGRRRVFNDVLVAPRRTDNVMTDDSLLNWYVMAGRAGSQMPSGR
jgi:hypothetical protein